MTKMTPEELEAFKADAARKQAEYEAKRRKRADEVRAQNDAKFGKGPM